MKKSIAAASCSGVYFFTGFNPGIVKTALFLFPAPVRKYVAEQEEGYLEDGHY